MNNVQTLKGFRDFLPNEARKRQFVISQLKQTFETYGFEPLETPTLEYEEILAGKYGEEGEKLMYRFEDNGKRRVAMRYDQTVPLARVIAQYKHMLTFPFKRYQIQNVWRADKPQRGRYREFLQCDADVVGTNAIHSDSEILAVVNASLRRLGFEKYTIFVNDRSVFGTLPPKAITIIDKLKKIGEKNVIKELEEAGFSENDFFNVQKAQMPQNLSAIVDSAVSLGVERNTIVFDPTLARGLDYYTGLIFEIEIAGYTVGSVCGGGRYDTLLTMFTKDPLPAVGFAFGFDRIIEAMEEKKLFPASVATTSQVLVTIFAEELTSLSQAVAVQLRNAQIPTELWLDPRTKMDKQLKYASQKNIPYVVLIGPEEAEKNVVTLRNMHKREQQQDTIENIIKMII